MNDDFKLIAIVELQKDNKLTFVKIYNNELMNELLIIETKQAKKKTSIIDYGIDYDNLINELAKDITNSSYFDIEIINDNDFIKNDINEAIKNLNE